MGARQKVFFQKRGRSTEPALLFVSLLSLFLTAHGAECSSEGSLPCTFGPCSFSTDASGVLDRTGSCPDQQGNLYFSGIKTLRDGVFNNMRGCQYLSLTNNKLSHLPETIFSGLTRLRLLYLDYSDLSNLPETIFRGLTSLE